MKKLILAVIALTCVIFWHIAQPVQPPIQSMTAPRRTNLMVTDGTRSDVLTELRFSAITSVNGAVTLKTNPLTIGTSKGRIKWNSSTQKLQFSNNSGILWKDLGSGGSASGYALHSASHGYTYLSKTGSFTDFDAAYLQIAAYVNFSSLNTAENVLHRIENDYSCTMMRFGKSASNKLIFTHGLTYAPSCGFKTYSSTVSLDSRHQDVWTELAVKVHPAGNLTFYVNGYVFGASRTMTSSTMTTYAEETLNIYEGWGGSGGPLTVMVDINWPESGYKGLSATSNFIAWPQFRLPLSEGIGTTTTETINAESWNIDAHIAWEEVTTW